MEPSLEEQILSAVELFHYSYKFRESIFAIVVDGLETLRKFLPDLKVLQSSRIRTLIIAPECPTLVEELKQLILRGHLLELVTLSPGEEIPRRSVRADMNQGEIPVLALRASSISPFEPCSFYDSALSTAAAVGVRKVFFPGSFYGLEIDGEFRSHLAPSDMEKLLSSPAETNLSREFLAYLAVKQSAYTFDIILLEAKVGTLFQEIFSHRGAGTLFSREYSNVFRQAKPSDTSDIALLMKPYIRNGAILSVTEDKIIESLNDYYVYTVNGQIVATAKLTDYGESSEIGKICTLPRYQRKGRARAISEKIIELAKSRGKKWVFSLSTQEKMFVFFRQLGFLEVPREELPDEWKKGYDFSRPSRSFRLDLV